MSIKTYKISLRVPLANIDNFSSINWYFVQIQKHITIGTWNVYQKIMVTFSIHGIN